MSQRVPDEPAEKADQAKPDEAKASTTDPPPSAVRPSRPQVSTPASDPPNDDKDKADTLQADGAPRGDDGVPAETRLERVKTKGKDANDFRAPPPDLPTRYARLANRDWHRKIKGWCAKKFNLTSWVAEDLFQDACEKAMRLKDWPAEEKPTLSWLFKVMRNICFDHLRAESTRARFEMSIEDLDVAQERDEEADAKDFAQYAMREAAENPKVAAGIDMLVDHHVLGADVPEMAVKNSVSEGVVYARMRGAREVLQSGWFKISAGIAVGFIILLLLTKLRWDGDTRVSSPHERVPDAEVPLLALPSHAEAGALRGRALRACSEGEYRWCLENLNHARRIDPEGDNAPDVKAARQKAEGKLGVREKHEP